MEEIAQQYLDVQGELPLSSRRLLADRVLYCCTMTNLTPILSDARKEFSAEESGLLGLADGLTSYSHRELRVFDLYFDEITTGDLSQTEKHPGRWCRYHNGPKIDAHIGDLRARKTWAKIAATANLGTMKSVYAP